MTAYTEIQAYPLEWKIGVGIFIMLTLFVIPRFDNKVRRLLIALLVFVDLFAIYFVSRKLETHIDKTGIYYKMSPAWYGAQYLSWDSISTVSVQRMYRYTTRMPAKAYSITGKYAVFIRTENDKRIILGTQHPDEMNAALLKFSRARYQ
ncbi:MAG: hypothetical protein K0Q79_1353 [Flavipsychrobacter sp.]|nr:hypothetical protein [Flavipsychrobacter sp.]